MFLKRNLLTSLALFCAFFVVVTVDEVSAQDHPNIVIILVDDMGYGDAKCYNANSKIPTPHINSLAKAGMRFTDAHAPGPLCHMSRYGLMTGRYPFRTKVGRWPKHALIEKGQMTIASQLKSKGYRTAMVGKWHLGFEENGYDNPLPGGPVDVGFDSYFGIRASTDIPPYFYIRNRKAVSPPTNKIQANYSDGWSRIQGAFWRAGGIAPDLKLANVLPKFTDEAISVIDSHAKNQQTSKTKQPLLLYLAYPAPHTPWLPSKKYKGKSGASMYGDFLMMVDGMIGKVLKAIDDAKMKDDTIVFFTSDNGPVWYEKDVKRFDHDSSGGLRGMKADAWECGHRMPFIVRWPNKIKAGSVSDKLICFTDFLATFAELNDAKLSKDDGPDSFSFLNELLDKKATNDFPVRNSLVIRSGNGAQTIRVGDWKLIDRLGSGGFSKPNRIKPGPNDPKGQLYNLANDFGETKNLWKDKPEIVEKLKQKLAEIVQAGGSRLSN